GVQFSRGRVLGKCHGPSLFPSYGVGLQVMSGETVTLGTFLDGDQPRAMWAGCPRSCRRRVPASLTARRSWHQTDGTAHCVNDGDLPRGNSGSDEIVGPCQDVAVSKLARPRRGFVIEGVPQSEPIANAGIGLGWREQCEKPTIRQEENLLPCKVRPNRPN